jgi:broad specificity polyphosphatase/5'/3'-nucleotidase SurE
MQTLYEDDDVIIKLATDGTIRIIAKHSPGMDNFLLVWARSNGDIEVSAPNSNWSSVADGYTLSLQEYPQ